MPITEVWKDIKGYEGLYQVSNFGKVKSMKLQINKIFYLHNGYYTVNLYKDKRQKNNFVHRLVAQTFICNPDNKITVNHINGIKTDNNTNNLEWMTYKENNQHAINCGLSNPKNNKRNYKKVKCLETNICYNSIKEAAILLGINATNICMCCKKRRNTTHGYHWTYIY